MSGWSGLFTGVQRGRGRRRIPYSQSQSDVVCSYQVTQQQQRVGETSTVETYTTFLFSPARTARSARRGTAYYNASYKSRWGRRCPCAREPRGAVVAAVVAAVGPHPVVPLQMLLRHLRHSGLEQEVGASGSAGAGPSHQT